MNPRTFCVIDYETRSKADIKKVGAYEYARHPSTELLCVSWRIGTRKVLRSQETKIWSPKIPSPYGEFKKALLDESVILVAHNAFFEQVITRFVLPKYISNEELKSIPVSRWVCTASLARALALPGKLAEACAALKLPIQKDMEGHRLMMKMSKPRKATKTNQDPWHEGKDDLERLMQYCVTDTDAETELFLRLPGLIPSERKVWKLDQKINWRGFRCDRPLVKKILRLMTQESARFAKETHRLTGGKIRSFGQRNATLAFLKEEGFEMENLQKKTVSDALAGPGCEGRVREVLSLRLEIAKASTAKYAAFESRSRSDGRIRDSLTYHAASTGRFGGAGVQPHNFPRGSIANSALAASIMEDKKTDLETIRLLYGSPLEAFSSCLRAMIIPSEGKELFGGDFSGIEVRVLFWLARHLDGLKAYEEDRDLYREIATEIYRKKLKDVEDPEREVGKRAILGCGFGMGKKKFAETCELFGQPVTAELAEAAVEAYRSTHWPVCRLWYNLEKAAILAVQNPGKKYTINRITWIVEGKFLYAVLPSGRRLAYYGPEAKMRKTPWGEKRPCLHHFDIHPKTKQWVFLGTYGGKLAENVTQAVARDIMVEAMLRLEVMGYDVLLTVHDEILSEKEIGTGSVAQFEFMMKKVPEWAEGLPVEAKCYKAMRYKK